MNRHHLLHAAIAAALALAAAPAVAASGAEAQPIRVEPTIHALRVDSAPAKDGSATAPKPAAAFSMPGPVAVMHGRVNAAGQMETWCSIEHDHRSVHGANRAPRREQQR